MKPQQYKSIGWTTSKGCKTFQRRSPSGIQQKQERTAVVKVSTYTKSDFTETWLSAVVMETNNSLVMFQKHISWEFSGQKTPPRNYLVLIITLLNEKMILKLFGKSFKYNDALCLTISNPVLLLFKSSKEQFVIITLIPCVKV